MIKSGYNANDMRRRNRRKLIELLRVSSKSRADLARETGLTRSAVSVLVEDMIKEGFLLEGGMVDGGKGRRTIGLRLNGEKYHIISINIARDVCSVGLADFAGKILKILRVDTDALNVSLGSSLEVLGNMVDELLGGLPPEELLGIGICAPGPLDSSLGEILNPPYFAMWHHASVVQWFRARYACAVYLENIAKSMALAEKFYGIGGRYHNYMELIVDIGIGGGIVLNGRLYRGISGFAGEIGHISVELNGKPCDCGNRGCLEQYASIPSLLAYGREQGIFYSSWRSVMDMSEDDEGARFLYQREVDLLSSILVSACNFMDLEAVILQGDISYEAERLAEDLKVRINQSFIGRERRHIEVCPSALPGNAQVLAGINLVLEYFNQQME